ncbi:MAG: cell division/cell wall cluster transcriptional repressor MraZ [Pseudomonadota bacterium]
MRLRFSGNDTHKVDEKGRVSIPADFRRVLDAQDPHRDPDTQPRIHILYGDKREPWLTCHSMDSIDRIGDLLDEMDEGDPKLPGLEAYYFGHADRATLDPSGRLVLGAKLRQRAGITKQAAFMGMGKTFRIYSPDAPIEAVDPLEQMISGLSDGESIRGQLPPRRRAAE